MSNPSQPELPPVPSTLKIIDPPPPPRQAVPPQVDDRPPPSDPEALPSKDSPNAPPAEPESASKVEAREPRTDSNGKVIVPPTLGFEPQNFDEMWRMAGWLATTQFVPKPVQGKRQDVMFMLMFGKARGLTLMQSAQLYVIDGKITLPAETMLSLILSSKFCKYMRPTRSTLEVAEWTTLRRGEDQGVVTMDYTIGEAQQMGLLDKGKDQWAKDNNQWKRQPRNMLRWRALTTIGRLVYPDVVGGFYEHSEVLDIIEMRGGNPEIMPLTQDVVDNAKDGTPPPAINLSLSASTMTPEEVAMRAALEGKSAAPERQPEPVRRASSTTSRVAEKAAAARTKDTRQDEPPVCPTCQGPVAKPGLCDGCKGS